MSVKLYFPRSHIYYFPKNFEDLSEEQREHFYQDIRIMKERNQVRWDVNLFRWSLLVLKTGCGGCRAPEEIPEKKLSSMNSFFVYFSG